jgi:glycosyltransferase involved in cell wall biosynthesis
MEFSFSMNQKDRDLFYRQTGEPETFRVPAASSPSQETDAASGSGILGRRARIVFLNDSSDVSGAERSLMLLLRNLDPRLFNVSVVCPREGPLVQELQQIGVQVIPLDITRCSLNQRPLNYLLSLLRIYWAIRKLDVDLIHCNSGWAAHWGLPLGRMLGKRVVCHVRCFDESGLSPLIFRKASPRTIFIAISKAVWEGLRRAGVPQEQIKLVYSGVDVGAYSSVAFSAALEREFQLKREEYRVGILGRIEGSKRHIDAIEALYHLVPEVNARLFVIDEPGGDPGLERELKSRIWELGLEARVVFTGERKDRGELLAALDVVVEPSIEEAFGSGTIEAMAAGKPVIGAESGCAREIIQHGVNGLMVPIKSPEAIAVTLKRLFRDPDFARELGQNARRRVLENFTMETYVRHIQRLYMEAVPAVFGRP